MRPAPLGARGRYSGTKNSGVGRRTGIVPGIGQLRLCGSRNALAYLDLLEACCACAASDTVSRLSACCRRSAHFSPTLGSDGSPTAFRPSLRSSRARTRKTRRSNYEDLLALTVRRLRCTFEAARTFTSAEIVDAMPTEPTRLGGIGEDRVLTSPAFELATLALHQASPPTAFSITI